MENEKITEEQKQKFEKLYKNTYVRLEDVIKIIGENAERAVDRFKILDKKSQEVREDKESVGIEGIDICTDMSKEVGIINNSKILVEEMVKAIVEKKINFIVSGE